MPSQKSSKILGSVVRFNGGEERLKLESPRPAVSAADQQKPFIPTERDARLVLIVIIRILLWLIYLELPPSLELGRQCGPYPQLRLAPQKHSPAVV